MAMELLLAHSPPLVALPVSRSSIAERPSFLSGQALPLDLTRRRSNARSPNCVDNFGSWTTGPIHVTTKSRAKTIRASGQDSGPKDGDVAFVAGATGRVGSRALRELLKLGFQVRAGVRSKQKANTLVNSVQQMEGGQYVEKLEIVECDLEKREGIESAIGSASVVLCCIGASEKEIFDITGPYRIDYLATKNLIDAATNAKVNHFILLTSLGTNKIGFPAAILNLFWGVLIWKRKAEEALIASGLPYSIVRPGGMERPTDTYKLTHNMVLSVEDTLFGGQVSNLQVAELMAFMAKNRNLSFCKVVEVIAETTAPLKPMEDLLSKIPSNSVDTSKLEESPALKKPEPAPAQVIVSEPKVDEEKIEPEAPKTTPLSPYIAYDDLKPPTSPRPPTGVSDLKKASVGAVNASQAPVINKTPAKQNFNQHQRKPLSPFTMYEDLKPPSSPSPSFK